MKPIIEIKETRKIGRGLYAARYIRKGEVVERSPVIVISEYAPVNDNVLNTYLFEWVGRQRSLALGLGSLFNHSAKRPNVTYNPCFQTREILFVATRNIRKGEQLFINYGYDPKHGIEITERNLFERLKQKFEPKEKLRVCLGAIEGSKEVEKLDDRL